MSVSEAFVSTSSTKLLPTLLTTARGRNTAGLVATPVRGSGGRKPVEKEGETVVQKR